MLRRQFLSAAILAAGSLATATIPATIATAAEKSYRLSGPYTYKNLSIYLIHRDGLKEGPVPLTLSEAMKAGVVKVIETGNVNRLMIRNLGDREVFIQAGDIVKGGKQDRVLTISMIVPPKSGAIPIGAFCVERGRWAKRGQEKVAEFSASTARLPSKAGKIAMMERAKRAAPRRVVRQSRAQSGLQRLTTQRALSPTRQGSVWDSVRKVQSKLSKVMKKDFADKRSRSSLQLSLENKALVKALGGYRQALGKLLEKHPTAVGYVFAINGKINSGDEFGSAGLFRKLWQRQLEAAATEAIAEAKSLTRKPPELADVTAFIEKARAAKPAWKPMPGHMRLETRETKKTLYTETRRKSGRWVHRNFIAY